MYLKFNNINTVYNVTYDANNSAQIQLIFHLKKDEYDIGLYAALNGSVSMENVKVYLDEACSVLVAEFKGYKTIHYTMDNASGIVCVTIQSDDVVAQIKTLSDALIAANSIIQGLNIKVTEINNKINPVQENPLNYTAAQAKAYQISIVNMECENTIHAGIDVETSMGTEHFSLTDNDQINLTGVYNEILSGAKVVPYHADNSLCRSFSAAEILAIANAAKRYKTYCTTKCNHLHVWINRSTVVKDILDIHFTSSLPDDLNNSLNGIIAMDASSSYGTN